MKLYIAADVIWRRVLARVVVTDEGCWRWTGAVNSRGYGCIGSGRSHRTVTVHRLAVHVRDGSIPEGMTVDHTCHDAGRCRAGDACPHRRCVNPTHLAVCTAVANRGRAHRERYLVAAP